MTLWRNLCGKNSKSTGGLAARRPRICLESDTICHPIDLTARSSHFDRLNTPITCTQMPIRASSAIRPAQIGSWFSRVTRRSGLPSGWSFSTTQKKSAPREHREAIE